MKGDYCTQAVSKLRLTDKVERNPTPGRYCTVWPEKEKTISGTAAIRCFLKSNPAYDLIKRGDPEGDLRYQALEKDTVASD